MILAVCIPLSSSGYPGVNGESHRGGVHGKRLRYMHAPQEAYTSTLVKPVVVPTIIGAVLFCLVLPGELTLYPVDTPVRFAVYPWIATVTYLGVNSRYRRGVLLVPW